MLLLLSIWCGLVAGLLEVLTIVVRKHAIDPNQLYGMTRHFPWLIPAINVAIFIGFGILFSFASLLWPVGARRLFARVMGAMVLLPSLLVAFPQIYVPAVLIIAMGTAVMVVPVLERHRSRVHRLVRMTIPILAAIVLGLAGLIVGGDWLKQNRERSLPDARANAPNILLIVMDTVAADHLGAYGYTRPTSATLDELAKSGIRFTSAQASSSWTLPSHASMFTGKWPHEITANWLTPLDDGSPTVAEFLRDRGYATAGFVANNLYCATDSGLGRGFSVYHDYIFPRLTAIKPAALVDRSVAGLELLEHFLEDWLDVDILTPALRYVWWLVSADRKDAATVNHEFIDWLSSRQNSKTPFFAFLNYYDAHYPYQLPPLGVHRFGAAPRERREFELIQNWWPLDKRELPDQEVAFVRDSYDDCVAHLDEQLGRLIDDLRERGALERTWLVVVSDHGESFGEHPGVFCHGTSLYQTELHVPLIVVPPTQAPEGLVIDQTVSLRDMAATIVDFAGLASESPFPGQSLARFWDAGSSKSGESVPGDGVALAEVVPNDPQSNPNRSRLLERNWPLAALAERSWTYIRREGDVREELFDRRNDAKETRNLAADPTAADTLTRMRAALGRMTGGPLTPDRFHP